MSHLLEDHPDWPKNAMTTPTPRTDALQNRVCNEADRLIAEGRDAETRERMNDLLQESYDHARQLERELAAAREELAQFREDRAVLVDVCKEWQDRAAQEKP